MMKKDIHVTQEHIDKGHRGNACLCPVARAIAEAFGLKLFEVAVCKRLAGYYRHPESVESADGYAVEFYVPGISGSNWILDDEVYEWIENFDSRKVVEPFSFVLEGAWHEIPAPTT